MAQTFSQIIQTYQSKSQLYRHLQSTLFVMTEPEVLDIYPIISLCQQNLNAIQKLHFKFELSYDEANALEETIQELLTHIPTITSHYHQFRAVLSTLESVGTAGLSVLKSADVMTKLDAGFSLTGRYDRISDDDFERKRLFWLDLYALNEFEEHIRQLLSYGTAQNLEIGHDSQDKQLNSIQKILICFGIGMSQTLESSVFSNLPPIWDTFLSESRALASSSQTLRKIAISNLQDDLTLICNELDTLVTDSRHHGKAGIQFESLLFTKAPARKIRDAVERTIELFNV